VADGTDGAFDVDDVIAAEPKQRTCRNRVYFANVETGRRRILGGQRAGGGEGDEDVGQADDSHF
jgi:hypothetical protein